MVPTLPIEPLLPQLRQSLARERNLVLQAPPGAGKTTRVPLALLDAPWLDQRKILLLEPRRLAARAAARFMAAALGERIGETVGYRVRLESRVGPRTRIEVVTEGVLTRMLQDDPALQSVGLVIFDEFHERSLHADLGLALCLDSQSALNETLRVLVMSATLDGAAVARLLGDARVLRSEGRSFPVTVHYRPARQPSRRHAVVTDDLVREIRRAIDEESGSVLVFLPGAGEIRQLENALHGAQIGPDVIIAPLYGQLGSAAQDLAIQPAPPGKRKLVLATSIAETSLTIEGIRIVIDAGLMRQPRFDPGSGLTRLVTLPVSRAAADQRCGRAGRLEAGVCYRLWPEHQHLLPAARPEILEADLAPLVLELAQWGVQDAAQLRWLDSPPAAHLAQARQLLQQLGALDGGGRITAHGRAMLQLGAHPRLAHMMLRARELGYAALACELAALLSERDPLRGARATEADMLLRLDLLRRRGTGQGSDKGLSGRVKDTARQWQRQLGGGSASSVAADDAMAGALLAFAWPDRIGQRRGGVDGRFLLSNGRGAMLRDPEPLAAADYLVAAQLGDGREARIFLAAEVQREQLQEYHGDLLSAHCFVAWDDREQCVRARRQLRLGELVLTDEAWPDADPQEIQAALLEGVRRRGIACLPWNEAARGLQARLNFLHHLVPAEWEDVSDDALLAGLEHWLLPHLAGMTRLAQLQRLDLHALLLAPLSWTRQRQLRELAPEFLTVPSGSRVRLDYSQDIPVLAVRLQEMFGLADTPRIAGGRVPVLLHLLSPARRPVQVTQQLGSFWQGSYHEVRKELKGRYPKHHWPEDPLQAQATAATRRKR
ncbi:MAG: ATP-dependent helicase HrpB [Thiogranum sp.]|nr:ATP-dependent helicase HrpB [Thiogranum sp.]